MEFLETLRPEAQLIILWRHVNGEHISLSVERIALTEARRVKTFNREVSLRDSALACSSHDWKVESHDVAI